MMSWLIFVGGVNDVGSELEIGELTSISSRVPLILLRENTPGEGMDLSPPHLLVK